MEIKAATFPIRTTNEYLEVVGKAADKAGLSKQEFIIEAISEKVAKVMKKGD